MASMGYAVPVAVGVAFASPDSQVICICGDGGFHMATQSLMLIAQYGLKVSVVVLNNEALGMITQFQSLYFGGNMAGTPSEGGYLVPDIGCIAAAYKIPFRKVMVEGEVKADLFNGPSLIEVNTGGLTTVVPKLEYNKSLADMTPAWPLTEESRK